LKKVSRLKNNFPFFHFRFIINRNFKCYKSRKEFFNRQS